MGFKIYKGELLALRKGLIGQKVLTAPTDGVLEQYNEERGELELKLLPKQVPLTSGVFGIVDYINQATGEVIIKTTATQLNGVLGSGKERGGLLNVLGADSGLLPENRITPSYEGQILAAGSLILSDALKQAAKLGVYGIITGGINARDFKAMVGTLNPNLRLGNDAGISLMATEGYGSLPIGPDIFNYLKAYHGKFVILNGNTSLLILPSFDRDCIMKLRKVALPLSKEPESNLNIGVKEVEMGSKVRIIWPPFAGLQGKVVGIDKSPTTLASGISTYLISIETPSRKLKVSSANIEII